MFTAIALALILIALPSAALAMERQMTISQVIQPCSVVGAIGKSHWSCSHCIHRTLTNVDYRDLAETYVT